LAFTVVQVEEFCVRNGVNVLSVSLGEGKALGQASIVANLILQKKGTAKNASGKKHDRIADEEPAQPSIDELPALVCDMLREKDFCGRAIRVKDVTFEGRQRKRSSGANRYFLEGMACKCNNCGAVGHMMKECDLPVIPPPCHLCAGQDHESGERIF
jgi:hypothetical protein